MKNYHQPVSSFLNDFAKAHREINDGLLEELKNQFLVTLESVSEIFGPELLFRPPANKKKKQTFNVAIFDAQMLAVQGLSSKKLNSAIQQKTAIQKKYEKLFDETDFIDSVTKATTNKSNLVHRINSVKAIF